MKWMRTLKWLKVISMMQTNDRMSLMRNHMALSLLVFLGRSYPDIMHLNKALISQEVAIGSYAKRHAGCMLKVDYTYS